METDWHAGEQKTHTKNIKTHLSKTQPSSNLSAFDKIQMKTRSPHRPALSPFIHLVSSFFVVLQPACWPLTPEWGRGRSRDRRGRERNSPGRNAEGGGGFHLNPYLQHSDRLLGLMNWCHVSRVLLTTFELSKQQAECLHVFSQGRHVFTTQPLTRRAAVFVLRH